MITYLMFIYLFVGICLCYKSNICADYCINVYYCINIKLTVGVMM